MILYKKGGSLIVLIYLIFVKNFKELFIFLLIISHLASFAQYFINEGNPKSRRPPRNFSLLVGRCLLLIKRFN